MRYSEKQFELYNDLWRVLLYTKRQADALWEKADPQQIPSFSEQIRLTRNAINDNLATLVRFNAESTAKYHAASLKFYEELAGTPNNNPITNTDYTIE